VAVLAAAPADLRRALDGLDAEQRLTRYRDGGWTVAQVVHHLADSHANAFIRTKLALTEDGPTIVPYKEGAWAELADATGPDVDASLRILDGLHTRWVAVLRGLSPEQFSRPMVHPERGRLTVDWTLALYAWHSRHHIAHITSLRERMGW
jgi:hypothetical protein